MPNWKDFGGWWSKHVVEIAGGAIVLALLAGGAVFAVVQTPTDHNEEGNSARTTNNRSAVVPLGQPESPEPPGADPAPEPKVPGKFEITCPSAGPVPAQSGDAFACKVVSKEGFAQPVALKCLKPPAGLVCAVSPTTVTPAPDGTAEFHVTLSNNNVKPGKHSFKVVGTSGSVTGSFTWAFDTTETNPVADIGPPPAPAIVPGTDYSVDCGPPLTTMAAFSTANIGCEVRSGNFSGPLNVKVMPIDGTVPRLNITPSAFEIQPGGTVPVNIGIDASNYVGTGTFRLVVTVQHGDFYNFSSGGDTAKSKTVSLEVTPPTGPPFNPNLPPLPVPGA